MAEPIRQARGARMPLYERDKECHGCSATRPLLRRVQIWPGMIVDDEKFYLLLCLDCRVGWRDDQYCSLAETFLFNRVARARWRDAATI